MKTPRVSVVAGGGGIHVSIGEGRYEDGERVYDTPEDLKLWTREGMEKKLYKQKLTSRTIKEVEAWAIHLFQDLVHCELLVWIEQTQRWFFEQPDGTALEYLERRLDAADRFAIQLLEEMRDGK